MLSPQCDQGDLQLGAMLAQFIDLPRCLCQFVCMRFCSLVRGRLEGVEFFLQPCGLAAFAVNFQEKGVSSFSVQ